MELDESLADFLAQGGKIKRVDLFIATDPKGNVLARNTSKREIVKAIEAYQAKNKPIAIKVAYYKQSGDMEIRRAKWYKLPLVTTMTPDECRLNCVEKDSDEAAYMSVVQDLDPMPVPSLQVPNVNIINRIKVIDVKAPFKLDISKATLPGLNRLAQELKADKITCMSDLFAYLRMSTQYTDADAISFYLVKKGIDVNEHVNFC